MTSEINVKFRKERKWSRKLIVGFLRSRMPSVIYDIFLSVWYIFFKKQCATSTSYLSYSDGSWVNRKPTKDLLAIQSYLLSHANGKRIFQAGIGNSSLYGVLKNIPSTLIGITVVEDEIQHAQSNFDEASPCKYTFLLENKYTRGLGKFGKDFNIIVDNDISSYACCKKHFFDMLEAYRSMLVPRGYILIGKRGLGYFDSGFGMSRKMAEKFLSQRGFKLFLKDDIYFAEKI